MMEYGRNLYKHIETPQCTMKVICITILLSFQFWQIFSNLINLFERCKNRTIFETECFLNLFLEVSQI